MIDRVPIGVISEASREHNESYKMTVRLIKGINMIIVIKTLFMLSNSSAHNNCSTYECNWC